MAANYAAHVSTKATPQSMPVLGRSQVQNSAGGYVFAIDCWSRLDRFLILGNEGGTYYASEQKLTQENAKCVLECLAADAERTVARICEISEAGRAPKNDPAIFALALCASQGKVSSEQLRKVCRIGTHLFQFVDSVQHFRGWGRSLKRIVAEWYTAREQDQLAYQVAKYQQRNGWSHRDVLRLAKPKAEGNQAIRWAVGKTTETGIDILDAYEAAKKAADEKEIAVLIREHNLPRECVPTEWLNGIEVWRALLEKMPLTALVRSLAKMTNVGLLKPMGADNKLVLDKLADGEYLRKSRVHPLAILLAMKTYASGHGDKGKLTWSPVQPIVDALNDAFYAAFANVEPTNLRWYLGVDVSGSMAIGSVAGTSLTPREGAACLSLVTAATEKQHCIYGFTGDITTHYGGRYQNVPHVKSCSQAMTELGISPKVRLDTVVRKMENLTMGPTDCAMPMRHALEAGIEADVFVVLTDNETWCGSIHPFQALKQYRKATGINAKLIVVAMTATGFSIADPSDAGMLDVVGFDAATPQVMADFARGW